jgi:histidinol-phosphate aminotransferase
MSHPRPSPAVEGVKPYSVTPPPGVIDLKLDGNEGVAPPGGLLAELSALGPDVLRRYPDARPLEHLLARRLGVRPEQVLVTAGADEALDRACRAFLTPGRELIAPSPSFEMIPRYVRLAGGELIAVPWPRGDYPVGEVLSRITPRTAVIAVVTPNNPTGAVASAEHLRTLSDAAPKALLLVDLAYTEFADEDLTATALALPNAVAVRTLSKAYGLAGLRVGYVAGPEAVIGWMRAAGGPYSVSRPSLALAAMRLEAGDADVRAFVSRVREERARLHSQLAELGAEPIASQANFVLARFRDAAWVRDALGSLGIAVRCFPAQPGLENCLRITCPGDAAACERLLSALQHVLQCKAVCVDLDRVPVRPDAAHALAKRCRLAGCSSDPEVRERLGGVAEAFEAIAVAGPGGLRTALADAARGPTWLVSADADTLRLARSVGAVPVGLTTADATPEELHEAGAARVLTDLMQLEELLP